MPSNCPQCGAALQSNWNPTYCPVCLLGTGLASVHVPVETDRTAGLNPMHKGVFGDYQVLDQIGAGGMGVVYRALQISLNRVVALKMLRAPLTARADDRTRLRTEAGAAARLRHPNIVAVHEFGEHAGQPFFTMDYIEGRSLADLVREQPLDPPEAARQVKTIALAVHYAHNQGVLHRDLKPSNIMVDADSEPHVTDFGLAKLASSDSGHTVTGSVLGSPAYMPPEQARGSAEGTDVRGDVYSLGAILYELITGGPPFRSSSPAATLRLVLDSEPVAPRALNPRLPRDLETICLKCLAKSPHHRYATAAELADDLDRFRSGLPVRARPVSWLGRTARWCRRQPALAASAATLFLLLAALAVVSTVAAVRLDHEAHATQRARQEADAQLQSAQLAQARAERLSGQAGRFRRSLTAIERAARARPSLDLRNEAIATLQLPDITGIAAEWPTADHLAGDLESFDSSLRQCAVVRRPGMVSICRVPDFSVIREVPAPPGELRGVLFSPSGRYLAVASSTRRLDLWDLSTTNLIVRGTVLESSGHVLSASFSTPEHEFAIVTPDHRLRFFELPSGTERQAMLPGAPVYGVHLSSPRGYVALRMLSQVQVWSGANRSRVRTLMHEAVANCAQWHSDGVRLAVGSENGEVTLWNLKSGARRSLSAHTASVWRLGFFRNGEILWSTGIDNLTRFYDGASGAPLFSTEDTGPREATPDATRVAFLRPDNAFGIMNLRHASSLRTMSSPTAGPQFISASLSPDGRWFLAGSSYGWHLLDTETRREVAAFDIGQRIRAVLLPDLSAVIGNTTDRVLRWPLRWRTNNTPGTVDIGGPEVIFASQGRELQRLSITPNAAALAVGGHLRSVSFDLEETWNTSEFSRGFPQSFVSISPDRRFIAAADFFGRGITLWDRADGDLIRTLVPRVQGQALFSPDGKRLVTADLDVKVWDTRTWELIRRLDMRPAIQTEGTLAFSGDGRWLACSEQARIKLFDMTTCEEVATLTPPGMVRIVALAFSQDGSTVAAATQAESIHVWDLRELRSELRNLGLDWN